jgi:phosphatidate cytidylyltransferase
MSNLAQRLITGTIFVIVLVGCIIWNQWSMFVLLFAITLLGQNEFYTLAKKANVDPMRIGGVAIGLMLLTAFFYSGINNTAGHILFMLLIPAIFMLFIAELWRKKSNPMANIGWTLLGVIYVAFPMALLARTFGPKVTSIDGSIPSDWTIPYNYKGLLTIFILIWVSDSMAYVCGRLVGKRKLWERISPKKTWEGFIGGLLFCVVTGSVLGYYWLSDRFMDAAIMWGIIALVISVTGMFGDLVESMFKRSIDVKDSGTILPGHGGILDRFDALFIAAPFAVTVYYLSPMASHLIQVFFTR